MSIKADLKTGIKAAFEARRGDTENPEASLEALATDLAAVCAAAIKAGIEQQQITNVPVLSNSAGPVVGVITSTSTLTVE